MSDRRRDDTVRAVDLFCGAGGLSWGLAQACEELDHSVELAGERAIETHEQNHPWADHYHAKVEELDPRAVFESERVDVLTGGPQCTHHSNARGGRPVDEQVLSERDPTLQSFSPTPQKTVTDGGDGHE